MQAHDYLPASHLIPPHGITDRAKLKILIESMRREGWVGRPILVHDDGNGRHAWTGSHRIAAAKVVDRGMEDGEFLVPVVYITGDIERRREECCDDYDCLAVLEDAEDDDAIAVIKAEIASND